MRAVLIDMTAEPPAKAPEAKTGGSLRATLLPLRKPLAFASKHNFANLTNIKGLDSLVLRHTRRAMALDLPPRTKEVLSALREGYEQFNQLSLQRRKQLIRAALDLIDGTTTAARPPRAAPPCPACFDPAAIAVDEVRGIGPKTAHLLRQKNIFSVHDLLYMLPRTYMDSRAVSSIADLEPGMQAVVACTVCGAKTHYAGKKKIYELCLHEGPHSFSAKWFHVSGPFLAYLKKTFTAGKRVLVSGAVSRFRFALEMRHPEIELYHDEAPLKKSRSNMSLYPLSEGMHQKAVQRIMRQVVSTYARRIQEYLPESILSQYELMPLGEAFYRAHMPDSSIPLQSLATFSSPAHRRIIFDEFFMLQLGLALKKKSASVDAGTAFAVYERRLSDFVSGLPFTLTDAQQKCLQEILTDMQKPYAMHRLIQGDVGCGKTVVAVAAALTAVWNGFQAAFMAPTEILAHQHYKTICELTQGLDVRIDLASGSLSASDKKDVLHSIRQGSTQLIVGTHALIQDRVEFQRLGLAIIDEQHKFGVMQRAFLKNKGINPDMLVMTATPIPRTLGLTVYGDLDLSLIDELPAGRRAVDTRVYSDQQRDKVYELVRQELLKDRQAFIVYPLVEESEKLDLRDATRMSSHLQHDIFPEFRVGLIHGKMNASDKEAVMRQFQSHQLHLLVATTVVEVGIDVPNASLMIVEHAERFGLSQLHQLRGRVARSHTAALCILMSRHAASDDAQMRLDIVCKTNNGFRIAEEDFKIRGPGEFLGTKQSGLPDFRVAHLIRDTRILIQARQAAFDLVLRDPQLALPEHQMLKGMIQSTWKERFELASVG